MFGGEGIEMKVVYFVIWMCLLAACTTQRGSDADGDTAMVDTIAALPDTVYSSAARLKVKILRFDTITDGFLHDLTDPYLSANGIFTFRGNLLRNADYAGTVSGTPSRVEQVWKFKTEFDRTHTRYGTWGGGTGWTGQPLLAHWSDSIRMRFDNRSTGMTAAAPATEVIVASLCGNVYFIDYETGTASRTPLPTDNPIKGTPSLDPKRVGNLYVGQGIPATHPFGHMAFDLYSHTRSFFMGDDHDSWKRWWAFDSSPVRVDQFLFWPGEDGVIYKYLVHPDGSLSIHTKLLYSVKGGIAAGVENSLCVYRNYGFFGDNFGNILCINLNTMQPVWHYDNHDDIDATIVCEIDTTTDTPYIYTGCEVDRQGDEGTCYIVKLNALNGNLVWQQTINCHKYSDGDKHFDGGMYGTPLLGGGDCAHLLFANICQSENTEGKRGGELVAFSRADGSIVYRTPLKFYSWSSPVAFYNEQGQLFIFTADSKGNVYLLRGSTGEILFTQRMGNIFESSPAVNGSDVVIGSRGTEIYRFHIQ